MLPFRQDSPARGWRASQPLARPVRRAIRRCAGRQALMRHHESGEGARLERLLSPEHPGGGSTERPRVVFRLGGGAISAQRCDAAARHRHYLDGRNTRGAALHWSDLGVLRRPGDLRRCHRLPWPPNLLPEAKLLQEPRARAGGAYRRCTTPGWPTLLSLFQLAQWQARRGSSASHPVGRVPSTARMRCSIAIGKR